MIEICGKRDGFKVRGYNKDSNRRISPQAGVLAQLLRQLESVAWFASQIVRGSPYWLALYNSMLLTPVGSFKAAPYGGLNSVTFFHL